MLQEVLFADLNPGDRFTYEDKEFEKTSFAENRANAHSAQDGCVILTQDTPVLVEVPELDLWETDEDSAE